MRLVPALLAVALSACVMVPVHRPPPPPPRPAQPLTEQQAVDVAADYARARGLVIDRTTRAQLDGAGRWHIDLTGPGSSARVLVDAVSGRVLRAKLRRAAAQPPPAGPPSAPPGQPAPGQPAPGHDDDWDE